MPISVDRGAVKIGARIGGRRRKEHKTPDLVGRVEIPGLKTSARDQLVIAVLPNLLQLSSVKLQVVTVFERKKDLIDVHQCAAQVRAQGDDPVGRMSQFERILEPPG